MGQKINDLFLVMVMKLKLNLTTKKVQVKDKIQKHLYKKLKKKGGLSAEDSMRMTKIIHQAVLDISTKVSEALETMGEFLGEKQGSLRCRPMREH